jgi:DNA-binding MarR family transcriptional regulator
MRPPQPATRPATETSTQPVTRRPARPPTGRVVPALAVELRIAVLRTARRLRQERTVDDVTPGQFSVLASLDNHGPLTPRELANHEKVQPPSMTRTIAALEGLALVVRTDHPTDGRQVLVSLTAAGRDVVRETRRRRDAWLAHRLAEVSVEERAVLARAAIILARIAAT